MYLPSGADVAILECLRDLGLARSYQVALFVGAAGSTTAKRLARLHGAGLIERHAANAELRGARGNVVTGTVVWVATAAGLRHLAPVTVYGTGAEVELGKAKLAASKITHTLACNDVLIWYRAYGWHVVTERQILSAEAHTPKRPSAGRYWIAAATTRNFENQRIDLARFAGKATHPPDGALVLRGQPSTTELALEVEVSARRNADYAVSVASLQEAGRRQVWHVARPGVMTRLVDDVLGKLLRVEGAWADKNLWISTDRSVFIQRARLGKAHIGNIASADLGWAVPSWAPLGIAATRVTGPRWDGAVDLSHVTAAATAAREARRSQPSEPVEPFQDGWWVLDDAA